MKTILELGIFLIFLTSCNTGDQANSVDSSSEGDASSTFENIDWKDIDSDEALIATALMAAPEGKRSGCKVIGFNMEGKFVTLKEGTNEFICLADNPNENGFSAACYHKNLEPFMARGRELKAEGKSFQEIFDIREAEAKAGKLDMGGQGSTLHIYYGSNERYNPETNEVDGAIYRYVVYLPWATAESTGLPEKPVAGNHPWIMNPGTHRAHIMISPLND